MGSFRGPRRYRLAAIGTAALLAAGGLIVFDAASASAGDPLRYVATTGSDAGNDCTNIAKPCQTVQHAIDQADVNDTVTIAAGTYGESVLVEKSLTLSGTGRSKPTVHGGSGGDASIVIGGSAAVVTIKNLDVSGNSNNDGVDVAGNDTVAIANSTLFGNGGAGVDVGADGSPTVSLSNDVIYGNTGQGVTAGFTTLSGDHLVVSDNGHGGLVAVEGTTTISDSTFDRNKGAGVIVANGTGTLNASTVSNSTMLNDDTDATFTGAGVLSFLGSTVTVNQSTIFHNVGQGVMTENATATVRNSTIDGTQPTPASDGNASLSGALTNVSVNTPNALDGFDVRTSTSTRAVTSTLTAVGTLVTGNATRACTGTVTDQGYNLSDDATCAFTAAGSKNGGKAKLGAFGSHGGPTNTLVPMKGSDAIDQIPGGKAGCASTASDQRGHDRLQGTQCDVGSVEADQPVLVVMPARLPGGTTGTAYRVTLTATGGLGAPYVFALGSGSLPTGLTLSSTGVLSGTPTTVGTFTFTVVVDDPTFKTYTVQIGGGGPSLAATGTRVESMLELAAVALGLGVAMMLSAGYRRGQPT